ncbi:MAG: YggS family pyridoxal phosphate-dependent enzyme [Candidatus Omnitrophica bacterium]|nr:YggS family pyridoxal phosphate-dependent enzyme [Candidatus Omnitrophota bacterium]HOX54425.1 YggS family pyridoxal phosphate-dependent enzyme [Candidatus Omnitrophota bacterium]
MIKDNIARIKERIYLAAKKVSRSSDEITIVAVTKGVIPEKIIEAVNSGIKHIGENRIQEAEDKYLRLKGLCKESGVKWHMIGHLQTNKVKKALEMFDMIQSVDSLRLAEKINSDASMNNRVVDILVEVNTSGEASKSGIENDKAFELMDKISALENIRISGLMTVGPLTSDENRIRQAFASLRKLKEQAAKNYSFSNIKMNYLSMGMTDDYEIAIEEGSNMLRLGRAVFSNVQ